MSKTAMRRAKGETQTTSTQSGTDTQVRRPITGLRKGRIVKVTPGFKKSLEQEVSETEKEVEKLGEEIKSLEEEYKALEEKIATKKSAVCVLRDNLVTLKGWLDQMD